MMLGKSKRGVRFGQGIVQLQRFPGRCFSPWERLLRRNHSIVAKEIIGVSQARVCGGEYGIYFQRALELREGLLKQFWVLPGELVASSQVSLIGGGINRMRGAV